MAKEANIVTVGSTPELQSISFMFSTLERIWLGALFKNLSFKLWLFGEGGSIIDSGGQSVCVCVWGGGGGGAGYSKYETPPICWEC